MKKSKHTFRLSLISSQAVVTRRDRNELPRNPCGHQNLTLVSKQLDSIPSVDRVLVARHAENLYPSTRSTLAMSMSPCPWTPGIAAALIYKMFILCLSVGLSVCLWNATRLGQLLEMGLVGFHPLSSREEGRPEPLEWGTLFSIFPAGGLIVIHPRTGTAPGGTPW